uniref:Voltage-dependent L-type calcium channel subunit alpha-1D n=1 Tax=Macrostomum lignano TaxID=282301 RepID=A0A1I8GHH2_9PLAT
KLDDSATISNIVEPPGGVAAAAAASAGVELQQQCVDGSDSTHYRAALLICCELDWTAETGLHCASVKLLALASSQYSRPLPPVPRESTNNANNIEVKSAGCHHTVHRPPRCDIYASNSVPSPNPNAVPMGLKKRHSPMPTDSSRIFSSQSARHCESAYSYCSCFTSNCYGTTGAYVDSSDESSYEYLNQCASNRSTYQVDRSRQREPRLSQQLSTVSANNRQCHQGPVVSMLQCLHPAENRRTQSYDSFSSGRRRQSRQMHPRGHSRPSAQQRVQDCVGGSQTAVQIVFDSDCSRSPMCCVLKRDGEESSSEEESTEDCSGFPHKPYCFDESSDNEECDERSDGRMYRGSRSSRWSFNNYFCCCSRQRDQPMEQRRHPPTMLIRRDQRVMTARSRGECAGRVGKGSLVDCRTNC